MKREINGELDVLKNKLKSNQISPPLILSPNTSSPILAISANKRKLIDIYSGTNNSNNSEPFVKKRKLSLISHSDKKKKKTNKKKRV